MWSLSCQLPYCPGAILIPNLDWVNLKQIWIVKACLCFTGSWWVDAHDMSGFPSFRVSCVSCRVTILAQGLLHKPYYPQWKNLQLVFYPGENFTGLHEMCSTCEDPLFCVCVRVCTLFFFFFSTNLYVFMDGFLNYFPVIVPTTQNVSFLR